MPALFSTYSSDYQLVRLSDNRPILLPSQTVEAINKTMAIVHRDLQVVSFLSKRFGSVFEIGCDAGHLVAMCEYAGMKSFGIDIDKEAVKGCLKNGINAAFADMTLLTDPVFNHPYYRELHRRAIQSQVIVFLNFSHVQWQEKDGESLKEQLFGYAAKYFKYILCSLYDEDVLSYEKKYGLKLIHSFSSWRRQFNRADNLAIQYNEKVSTCCLETYINLQKLFVVDR